MITPATQTTNDTLTETWDVHLPFGLIGLPDLCRFQIAPLEGSWPFLSLQPIDDSDIRFLAIQPNGLIPEYQVQLADEDALSLGIEQSEEVCIFNIVTVHSTSPQHVTVNLVGPILVNRSTLIGRQVIIENAGAYSTTHRLVDERTPS